MYQHINTSRRYCFGYNIQPSLNGVVTAPDILIMQLHIRNRPNDLRHLPHVPPAMKPDDAIPALVSIRR